MDDENIQPVTTYTPEDSFQSPAKVPEQSRGHKSPGRLSRQYYTHSPKIKVEKTISKGNDGSKTDRSRSSASSPQKSTNSSPSGRLIKHTYMKPGQGENEIVKTRTLSRTSSLGSDTNPTFSKAEFSRRISIIRSWYDDLPIIKSRRDAMNNPDVSESPNPIETMRRPMLIETAEGLDIRFVLGILTDILSCRLCKGLFYNAHTVRECMHTFCKSCLILSTIECGLMCPTCFTPIPADILEGIEYDHNIQGLVDKIFPKFNEIESEQKKILDEIMGVSSTESTPMASFPRQSGSEAEGFVPHLSQLETPRSNLLNNTPFYLVDSTLNFISDILVDKEKNLDSFHGNVSCIALLHELDDIPLNNIMDSSNGDPVNDSHSSENTNADNSKYPRRYICVPKTAFIADIINYLIHELVLDPGLKIVTMLNNTVLPKNHSIEFICKSRRIDMSKCILIRYKIVE
ncbi:hypothetical protein BEWA_012490 [Theileria equi strain WA]|uniref:RING-type domain-containing protein n=1 Tax=Theileria equi strain WA TaxID=1537102 RepID=L1LBP6_THEEQ|nr:hypothetical protein BEWA_012490 [Theileria equi strain WA]EKX72690.1 hypothetical protein BEWA_012490 [Theileria equi strain WA]|eukprot:XP_004832142.1 hypothetical protein BEWA_012490 [Theileria equi strain WA]